eukprot:66413-Alexandrium_andersonii.AAC.1
MRAPRVSALAQALSGGHMPNAPAASHVGGHRDMPEAAMDDCCLAKDTSEKSLAAVVTKDRDS